MLKTQRQEEIITEVSRRGLASVADLASQLGVSEITVRRDLDELGRLGRLQRIRGGARRMLPRDPEPPVVQRQALQAGEKRAIGRAALELVQEGGTIGIESGSTTLELARAIGMRSWQRLHIVTNSFIVVDELARTPGVRLVFVGGSVNPGEMGTFGTLAEQALGCVNLDRVFLTCRGLDPRAGLTNEPAAEGTLATERALVRVAREVIVLADHTKLGRVFGLQALPLGDVDVVITDSLAQEEVLAELRRQGVRVIVAADGERR